MSIGILDWDLFESQFESAKRAKMGKGGQSAARALREATNKHRQFARAASGRAVMAAAFYFKQNRGMSPLIGRFPWTTRTPDRSPDSGLEAEEPCGEL